MTLWLVSLQNNDYCKKQQHKSKVKVFIKRSGSTCSAFVF